MKNTKDYPIYDSSEHRAAGVEEFREVFHYRNLIVQLVRRDILTRYKRSILGVAWTMLNPLGTMIVLTLVFSNSFGANEKSFAAYVLSGYMAWNFFAQTTNAAMINLVWGGSLLRRIYIPRTAFALSAIGTGLVNLLLSLVPLVIVMLVTGVHFNWTVILLPVPILFLAMFSLGMGLIISAIAIYFADVAEMYQIVLTAWMYLSPVIYTESLLPEKYRYWLTHLNPMYFLIRFFRAPIYDGRLPFLSEFLVSGIVAVGTLLVGWFFFSRKSDEFAYRV